MKVTEDDPTLEGDPLGVGPTCDPNDYSPTWPYDSTDLQFVYDPGTYGDHTAHLWSLNSAEEMVDLMIATGQRIYLADINGEDEWVCNPSSLCASSHGAHWGYDNVSALRDMTLGTYGGPDVDAFGQPGTGCQVAATLGGAPVELWARVNDVDAPRAIVPAAILGMPGEPDYKEGLAPPSGDYDFEPGDAMSVEFELEAPGLPASTWSAHPDWEAVVDFLFTKSWTNEPFWHQNILLTTAVNGNPVASLTGDIDGLGNEMIGRMVGCAEGSACAVSEWDATAYYVNTVEFTISPSSSTDQDQDRLVYLWGLRVQYRDTITGEVFWSSGSPDPLDAGLPSDAHQGTYSISGSPGAQALAVFNAPYRFDDLLDGVVFAREVGVPYHDFAWRRFARNACYYLHTVHGDTGTPARCMIDERAQVFSTTDYLTLDPIGVSARLLIGRDDTDGVIALYLPMDLENLAAGRGRFAPRDAITAGYEKMVVESRLARTILGETHEWMAQVPVGCAGSYTADVWVDKDANAPVFQWYVSHEDVSAGTAPFEFISYPVDDAGFSGQAYSASKTVDEYDYLYIGWRAEGGGHTLDDSNSVEFILNHAGGVHAAGIGDINGDGLDDVALGWTVQTEGRSGAGKEDFAGAVYLYLGPVTGTFTSTYERPDNVFTGNGSCDFLGWDIVSMGDVDLDGYDDFAVGAVDGWTGPPSGTAAVYRIHGPADIDTVRDAVTLVGPEPGADCLGSVLAPVPDQDGDGMVELLVGQQCSGEAHLLSGGGDATLTAGTDDLAHFIGPSGDSRFGHSFGVGDFDADGFVDAAVGAPEDVGAMDDGFVSVFAGPLTGTLTDTDATTTIEGPEQWAQLGGGLTAGDLNGDGYGDLAAGAPLLEGDDADTEFEGFVGVWQGPLEPGAQGIDSADLAIRGEYRNAGVGGEMDGLNDLNGDGQVDLYVGSGYLEVEGSQISARFSGTERAWAFYGPLDWGTVMAGEADAVLEYEELSGFAFQARVAGDTDGDGLPELLAGHYSLGSYLFHVPGGKF